MPMWIPDKERNKIAHECNALHTRARLLKAGVKKEIADVFTKEYEKRVHPIIYGDKKRKYPNKTRRLLNSNL